MESREQLDAKAATSFDLLDYIDDLSLGQPELTTDERLVQPFQLAADESLDDSTEYIDVTLPWLTITRALTPPLDSPLSGMNAANNPSVADVNQVLHERSSNIDSYGSSDTHAEDAIAAQDQPSPHKHKSRSRKNDNDAQADLQWRVDLSTLAVGASSTLEKFHLYKWRETLQLVGKAVCHTRLELQHALPSADILSHSLNLCGLQHKLLSVPSFHAIRLAGDDRALFESFHRAFPHEMVTKARFVSVLRSVYAIDDGVHRKLRRDEHALCSHLDRMQYAFKLSSDGVACVNWRLLLAGLRMFHEPLLSMKEHVTWTFREYSSSGFFEQPKDSDAISASQATHLLTHFLYNHAAARFVSERVSASVRLAMQSAHERASDLTSCAVYTD